MLKSPIKLPTTNRAQYGAPPTGSTLQLGLPATDAVIKRISFTGAAARSGNQLDFGEAHGLVEDQPLAFDGADPPAPLSQTSTYYAKVIDSTTIEVRSVPNGTAITLTDDGTGTIVLETMMFAKFVLLTNYGGYDIAFRPHVDNGYTISDTDDEALLPAAGCTPMILNVTGFKVLACRSIGTASDICIVPLENF